MHQEGFAKAQGTAHGELHVIAFHGIESAKLLLQSRTEAHPFGVANPSDQVGRN